VVTALARGYGTTWQFADATSFTIQSNTQATFVLSNLTGLNLIPNQTYVSSFQIGLPMLITEVNTATSTITVETTASFSRIGAIRLPELLTFFVPYQSGQIFSPYAAFFHNALGHTITIDGRAYALPFDDQGGFSTDLNSAANSTITVTLNPWAVAGPTGPVLVVAQGMSGTGTVRVGNQTFTPFPGFTNGVRVAVGDVNRDSQPNLIAAAGEGGGPHVTVIDITSGQTLYSFYAYEENFYGGVYVATGDVNKDGYFDIVTGPGVGGGPVVKVFSGKDGSLLASFFAYDPSFRGGVRVAVGDLNNDGYADIIVAPGAGGGPHILVFDGLALIRNGTPKVLASFMAYREDYRSGTFVTVGDVRGDGGLEIITGTDVEIEASLFTAEERFFEGPKVAIFDADGSNRSTFEAYPGESGPFSLNTFYGGVRVTTQPTSNGGQDRLVTASGEGIIPGLRKAGVVREFDVSGERPTQVGEDLTPFGEFLGGLYVAGT
jgi:hypothetical protein